VYCLIYKCSYRSYCLLHTVEDESQQVSTELTTYIENKLQILIVLSDILDGQEHFWINKLI